MKSLVVLTLLKAVSSSFFLSTMQKTADQLLQDFEDGMRKTWFPPSTTTEPFKQAADYIERALKESMRTELYAVLHEMTNHLTETNRLCENLQNKVVEMIEEINRDSRTADHRVKRLVHAIGYIGKEIEQLKSNQGISGDRNSTVMVLELLDAEHILRKMKQLLRETLIRTIENGNDQSLKTLLHLVIMNDVDKIHLLEKTEDGLKILNDLILPFRQSLLEFFTWVQTALKNGLRHSQDQIRKFKLTLQEVICHANDDSVKVVGEAVPSLLTSKDQLGILWDQLMITFRFIIDAKLSH